MFALQHFPFSAAQEPVERLRKLIATEREHLVTLIVEVNLAGAEVFVDGKSVGVAPLRDELFVEPGAQVVKATQRGYVTTEATFTAEVGTAWRVSLTLEREPPPRPTPRIEAQPPPAPGDDWAIRAVVVGGLTTTALLVIARKALPWFTRMRVGLARRWKRLHRGRRRLVPRAHRRR